MKSFMLMVGMFSVVLGGMALFMVALNECSNLLYSSNRWLRIVGGIGVILLLAIFFAMVAQSCDQRFAK